MDKQLTDAELIELGRRHLAEKELRELGELRKAALAEADEITKRLKERVKGLHEATGANPREIAEIVGVDQMAIRNWLGLVPNSTARSRKAAQAREAVKATEAPVDSTLLS